MQRQTKNEVFRIDFAKPPKIVKKEIEKYGMDRLTVKNLAEAIMLKKIDRVGSLITYSGGILYLSFLFKICGVCRCRDTSFL